MNLHELKGRSPIARGRTADVYAWGDEQVLKLFHAWVTEEAVAQELDVSRAVQEVGLPVARVGEIVVLEGRQGLLYERVVGPTMLEVLQARPWSLWKMARRLAALQVAVHDVTGVAGLPSQGARLAAQVAGAAQLDEALRRRLLRALEEMTQGERLCHGDFHPGNVILTERRPVIIDWTDAKLGNPAADVARTSVLALGEVQRAETPLRDKVLLRLLHGAYLRRMEQLRPGVAAEAAVWRPIVAAARMSEGIEGLQGWLATVARVQM